MNVRSFKFPGQYLSALYHSTIARWWGQAHNKPWEHSSESAMERIENGPAIRPTQAQIDDESRRIRRLRILVQLTLESIAAGDLTPEEASGMVAATRRVALEMFPGKERAFDLLYRPKFQRVMHAIYRLQ